MHFVIVTPFKVLNVLQVTLSCSESSVAWRLPGWGEDRARLRLWLLTWRVTHTHTLALTSNQSTNHVTLADTIQCRDRITIKL